MHAEILHLSAILFVWKSCFNTDHTCMGARTSSSCTTNTSFSSTKYRKSRSFPTWSHAAKLAQCVLHRKARLRGSKSKPYNPNPNPKTSAAPRLRPRLGLTHRLDHLHRRQPGDSANTDLQLYFYVCLCMCIYKYMRRNTYSCICMYTYAHTQLYYTYTHIHLHMY